MNASSTKCVIIGAGPAGLTAAWDLCRAGVPTVVFEKDDIVGGISRTVRYKGFRYDIGGHRFFTKVESVNQWWADILDKEFMDRPRMSRIYYADKFFDYPLKPANALFGLGVLEAMHCGFSYLRAQIAPTQPENNLEDWVSNRFGKRLFQIFFKTYTEKVWGIPCTEISADWAAQRIKNLDLLTAVRNALFGSGNPGGKGQVVTTLIESFRYPRLGPGMMWERVAELLTEQGYAPRMQYDVVRIRHDGKRVVSLVVRDRDGHEHDEQGSHFISSMPVRELVHALDPAPPKEVIEAADRLNYRDFLTVGLVIDKAEIFPDNWIYIHSPDVKVGRIQNFRSWSPFMVPEGETKNSIGLEYFVNENDEIWSSKDSDLIELGKRECEKLGLFRASDVSDGVVIRMPKAYPVYDKIYKDALATIRSYLESLPNLQLVGRNGQHRYNNQDHSMVTAMLAAQNVQGASHDVWAVNVDDEYHEEVKDDGKPKQLTHGQKGGDRLVPQRLEEDRMLGALREAYARYDAVALGAAVGTVMGLGLFLATAFLLLRGGLFVGENLQLLRNYFLGYEVSWSGAFLGLAEAGSFGFVFGFMLAKSINTTIALHERALVKRLEVMATLNAIDQERQ
ncbi:MAG TPA: NAD(P)/FAD-dependent oxidoreductase [Polyangiales bacterium]